MKFSVLFCLLALQGYAQIPHEPAAQPPPEIAPSPTAAPAGSPVNRPKPVGTPVPKSSTPEAAPAPSVDGLSLEGVKKATSALREDYVSPLSDDQVARATLQGLLDRLAPSVSLSGSGASTPSAAPFYAEAYQDRAGYLRPGSLTAPELERVRGTLREWSQKGLGAVILDLRGGPAGADFASAAGLAKLFCAKGTPLFKVVRFNGAEGARREFAAEEEPLFKGLLVILVDADTAEGLEAAAAVLRSAAKALLVGEGTEGRAFEFRDVPLDHGISLHVAVARAELPGGAAIGGLKPDIAEPQPRAGKEELMREVTAHGVGRVVAERGRAHMNEAALVAGTDPDIDTLEAEQQAAGRKPAAHPLDRQLQRALDLVTSISIFQAKRMPPAPSSGEE